MKIENILVCKQGSKEWHDFRSKHIGASEIAVVLGKSPYQTPYELWQIKTKQKEQRPVTDSMLAGQENEIYILEEFEKRMDKFVFSEVHEHDEYKFLSASLDGMSQDNDWIVEVKYCNKDVYLKAQEGTVVDYYYLQIQQQLLVTGIPKAYFFCYNPGYDNYATVEVFPNKIIQEQIIKEGKKFWDLVESKTPPELTNRDMPYKLLTTEEEWFDASENLENAKQIESQAREKLIKEANQNCVGNYVKIKRIPMETYDYKKACEENNIDIELYKNDKKYIWRISKLNK